MKEQIQQAARWLGRRGLGARVLKTTLAVVLAWEIGARIPSGPEHPYFAPLAALLSFQVTVAESITAAVQRIVGIVAGVTVALLVSRLVGETGWGVGLLVLLALVVGANLRLSPQGVSQVAVSALIVMVVGGSGSIEYAGARILESIVGAVIGVVVNAILIPPSYLPEARAALQAVAQAVADGLTGLSGDLATGLSPTQAAGYLVQARAAGGPLKAAQAALERAATSLKYNPLRRGDQAALDRYQQELARLEHSVLQLRSLARVLADAVDSPPEAIRWAEPGPLGRALADLLAALAAVVAHFPGDAAVLAGTWASGASARAEFDRCRAVVDRAAQAQQPALTPAGWMHLGALLATVDRLCADLVHPAAAGGED